MIIIMKWTNVLSSAQCREGKDVHGIIQTGDNHVIDKSFHI